MRIALHDEQIWNLDEVVEILNQPNGKGLDWYERTVFSILDYPDWFDHDLTS